MSPADRIRRWLNDAVVGLQLCPFAAPVVEAAVIEVVDSPDPEAQLHAALALAARMMDEPAIPTALVVLTGGGGGGEAMEFELFLDLAACLEDALDAAGAAGLLQVATFHPAYRFDGVSDDHLGNYTNRAPYPVLHLLREAHVSEAVRTHPDAAGIPDGNVARLEALGRDEILRRWARFLVGTRGGEAE